MAPGATKNREAFATLGPAVGIGGDAVRSARDPKALESARRKHVVAERLKSEKEGAARIRGPEEILYPS